MNHDFGAEYLEESEIPLFGGVYTWRVCTWTDDGLQSCTKHYALPS